MYHVPVIQLLFHVTGLLLYIALLPLVESAVDLMGKRHCKTPLDVEVSVYYCQLLFLQHTMVCT